jgi:hypothetical protein
VLIAGEVDTARDRAIVYKDAQGKQFVNGHGGFSTEELMKMPIDAAGLTVEFCEKFGGTFVGGNTLEKKYKDYPVIWSGNKTEARAYLHENGYDSHAITAEEKGFGVEYYEFCNRKLVITHTDKGLVEIKDMEAF